MNLPSPPQLDWYDVENALRELDRRLTALEGARTMRSGDTIFHRPSGEHWLVAAVSPKRDEVVCCGWPETIAKAADCEVVRHCTDAEHQEMLAEVIRSCPDQIRGSWARAALEGARTCSPASSASPAAASSSPSPPPYLSPSPGTCTPVFPSSSGSSGDSSAATSTTPSSIAEARSAAANLAHILFRHLGYSLNAILFDSSITIIANHLRRYKEGL